MSDGQSDRQTLTEEQHLEIERRAVTKSEFHNDQVFAMARGSPTHSSLANRIGALPDRQVPPACRTFNAHLRIKISSARVYTYADCTVLCGDPSTEGYDRGKKFELYRAIDSFREYLIVHQERRRVEHFSKREDSSWLLREHSGIDDAVVVASLGVRIALAELYASVFDPGQASPER